MHAPSNSPLTAVGVGVFDDPVFFLRNGVTDRLLLEGAAIQTRDLQYVPLSVDSCYPRDRRIGLIDVCTLNIGGLWSLTLGGFLALFPALYFVRQAVACWWRIIASILRRFGVPCRPRLVFGVLWSIHMAFSQPSLVYDRAATCRVMRPTRYLSLVSAPQLRH